MTCKHSLRCKRFEHFLYPCSRSGGYQGISSCWLYQMFERNPVMLSVDICRKEKCTYLVPDEVFATGTRKSMVCRLTGQLPRTMSECPKEGKK